MSMHRKRNKSLGLMELVAIALGGMVGGGIFTVLGISVSIIGSLTPAAIFIGGIIALLAAYSYIKLGVYFKDEGASFSFVKRTFPASHFAPSLIGWLVIFGYISTLALYAYTFSSYALSGFSVAQVVWIRKLVAVGIIGIFTLVNIWSVNGMGKIEDIMVYTKLGILLIISFLLIKSGAPQFSGFISNLSSDFKSSGVMNVLIVASITFVAYEGFQLVVNAVNEMRRPDKNIARAIYIAIVLAILLYLVISVGAILAIPKQDIIKNKEFALAAGAGKILGSFGSNLVIIGAILATSSAISGTLFGASRQMHAVALDGYFPSPLTKLRKNIPVRGVLLMAAVSSLLILAGGLQLILEFGSITFLVVSLLMAVTNFKMRKKTGSSPIITILVIIVLTIGSVLILYYEFKYDLKQMLFIVGLYIVLTILAFVFASKKKRSEQKNGSHPD